MVRYWTVTFKEGGQDYAVVYEGVKDGRYWLGGSASLMYPMLFSSKKKSDEAIKRVKLVELGDGGKSVWHRGEFVSRRAFIKV